VRARHWRQSTPWGDVTVVTSVRGIRAIGTEGDDIDELVGDTEESRDTTVARALDQFWNGRSKTLGVPLDFDGIDGFRRVVYETLVRDVGWGETVSYGELAEMSGRPRAARAVGTAMATNPLPYVIPCHRVIAAGGRIGGYGNGANAIAHKRALLAREGTIV
jgi:methylated-DNA-[protein]-cysteine S-methyltransferase